MVAIDPRYATQGFQIIAGLLLVTGKRHQSVERTDLRRLQRQDPVESSIAAFGQISSKNARRRANLANASMRLPSPLLPLSGSVRDRCFPAIERHIGAFAQQAGGGLDHQASEHMPDPRNRKWLPGRGTKTIRKSYRCAPPGNITTFSLVGKNACGIAACRIIRPAHRPTLGGVNLKKAKCKFGFRSILLKRRWVT